MALARDLVKLHGGRIEVGSEVGQTTNFTVHLPVRREAERVAIGHLDAAQHHVDYQLLEGAGKPMEQEGAPLLLIVEDHRDMRQHIRASLEGKYRVLEAENGKIGLEKALQAVPDLIITDVMMPEMDGFELCKALKENRSTSHIPLVMLTARAQAESRLEGLQTGADAYLSKPFQTAELRAILTNLIRTQQALRKQLRDELFTKPAPEKQLSMEEQFLKSCRDLMQTQLSNEFFGVEQMAADLGMSRKTLHRKLKALTGQTPNQFIRQFRLESAMQMLENKTGPVGEIAFLTGFSSHSYFSKCFIEYFGKSPSDV